MKKLYLTLFILVLSCHCFAITPITGPGSICVSTFATLSCSPAGGTWSSSNSAIALIDPSSGLISGLTPGTVTITYSVSSSYTTMSFTVNPLPMPISGNTNVCIGMTTNLTDGTTGGTWSSSNTSIATVNSIGTVYAVASSGASSINYTTPFGCFAGTMVHIVAPPSLITGPGIICANSNFTLTNLVSGGVWTSSDTSLATVNPSTGSTTFIAAGVVTITYTMGGGSCFTTRNTTINPLPETISRAAGDSVCPGSCFLFSDSTSGGSWSSSNTLVATIDPFTAYGCATPSPPTNTTIISYTSPSGCTTSFTLTNGSPSANITGQTWVCQGSSINLSERLASGTWSSSNTSIATVSTSGVVYGVAIGPVTISYTITGSCSTIATHTVTVIPMPGPILGTTSLCRGAITTLSDITVGGTWSSSNTSVATIGSITAIVTGVSAGTTIITYGLGSGCYNTTSVTVSSYLAPAPITGPDTLCSGGGIISLSDATTGGTWSSNLTAIATVNSSGVVTGISPGHPTINYTVPGGCLASYHIFVSAPPSAHVVASPNDTVCSGTATSYSVTVTGSSALSYQWSVGSFHVSTASTYAYIPLSGEVISVMLYITGACNGASLLYSDSVTMVVNPPPSVSAHAMQLCGGEYSLSATGATTYSWSPPSGLSCITCAVTTAPNSNMTYTVTGTTTACPGSGSAIVVTSCDQITGHILYTGGSSTDIFNVWLIHYNPADSTITALDSNLTCMDGSVPYYQFNYVPAGSYMVKAKLQGAVPGSTGWVPTYGLSSANWNTATTITHVTSALSVQDINMIYGAVPPGPGFISGNVYSGAGKGTSGEVPVEGMLIYLKNSTSGVLTYTFTDAAGAYSFTGLAYGDYYIWPEEFSYYTTPSATLTLDATHTSATDVNFKEHTDNGAITPFDVTGITTISSDALSIYPNPAAGSLTIQWNEKMNGNAAVAITDMLGREVYANTIIAPVGKSVLDISTLKAGVYMISIRSANIYGSSKLEIRK